MVVANNLLVILTTDLKKNYKESKKMPKEHKKKLSVTKRLQENQV